jgi:predicted ATPase/DNA-binding SARP family transcriptional activator
MPDRPPTTNRDPLRAGATGRPPLALTRFVGRGRELENLRRILGSSRLVTLTGSGGSGKTRLAQELAAVVTEDYAGAVHWVELAPLQDEMLVVEQAAEALGVRSRRGEAGIDAIVARIVDRPVLLVMDNCEHVIGGAAHLVKGLLHRCGHLTVLATSREVLSIPGETAWLVPPLSLPDPDAAPTPESLDRSEAVRLFLDRAADVVPAFRLTTANAADVARICRRLDGIPLALELAAAQLRTLGPTQLLARLDDRFRVLTSRARAALPRHRTLRAAIDWSYDLLSTEERLLMHRLSVFAGAFDLDAAEKVCAADAIDEAEVLSLVSGLVEKSLVEVLEEGSVVRYRLLETVRQYAGERLAADGSADMLYRRHARHFMTLVEEAEPHLTVPGRRAWIDRMAHDADNIRQALTWTRVADPTGHVALVGRLCWYWFGTEHWSEGRRWLEAALALPEAAARSRERAAALFALGVLAALQAQPDLARPALEEGLAIASEVGDQRLAAYARNYLGLTLASDGRKEAVPYLETALAHFRDADDLYGARLALLCLGAVAAGEGALDRAAAATEEGVAAARAFGQDRELAISLRQLAIVELRRGNASRAARLAGEALDALARDPQHYFIAISLEALAGAFADLGRPLEAARLFGAGEWVREGIGVAVPRVDAPVYEARIAAARDASGEPTFSEAWAAGRELSLGEAVAYARGAVAALGGETGAPSSPVASIVESSTPVGGLAVRALGPLEVEVDGRRVGPGDWSHARPRELLLLLLCHPAGRTRQEVGLALWPESSAAQVKNSFHVALHHLRKTLGRPERVRFENDRYRIAPELGVRFDAAEFEAGVKEARRAARDGTPGSLEVLRAALALYRGDFLAEESVGDWHMERRDHLRRLYVDGLVAMGDQLLRAEVNEEAVDVYRRVVLLDDLHEGAHRQLMIGYARMGERLLAIRQFERLAGLLREELSAEPEAETVALHRRILAAEPV